MPKFLEDKLKHEYGANSSIPYKVMNKIGAMRGNKETPKGEEMERKHLEHIRGGSVHVFDEDIHTAKAQIIDLDLDEISGAAYEPHGYSRMAKVHEGDEFD